MIWVMVNIWKNLQMLVYIMLDKNSKKNITKIPLTPMLKKDIFLKNPRILFIFVSYHMEKHKVSK